MKRHDPHVAVFPPSASSEILKSHARFEQMHRMFRWRILVVYIAPLLMLCAYFHYTYTSTLRKGIENHLKSIAENQRNIVDLFLRERVANLRSAFLRMDTTDSARPGFLDAFLENLRHKSAAFVDLGLFQPDGTLTSYVGPHESLLGTNYSDEAWFRSIHDQAQDYVISDVYLGFRKQPHFIVAVRKTIGDQDWYLRASVDPKKFGEFVGSSYLLENTEAFVVNREGEHQTFHKIEEAKHPFSMTPFEAAETRVATIDSNGDAYLSALAWLTEHDWALVVRIPASKAYAPLMHARVVSIGIVAVALVFIVITVLRSTNQLIERLKTSDTTKEDLRRQLFSAAKLASVGEIAAGVAHEINNPLAIIYEESSMMVDILDPTFNLEFKTDDFRERLQAVQAATMRGRAITSKLLAFARRHEPDPEPVDINLLIDQVLKVKATDFKVSNIRIVKAYTGGLPRVMVNPNQMEQVILNLLNNAKDAMEGEGTITIRTRLKARWVCLEIEDTGGGMPPEVVEKIFFPFFTTKGVGKGTGLGLSISYGIIETLGGRIEVKSQVGVGTTMKIRLPVQEFSIKHDSAVAQN